MDGSVYAIEHEESKKHIIRNMLKSSNYTDPSIKIVIAPSFASSWPTDSNPSDIPSETYASICWSFMMHPIMEYDK